MAHPVLNIKLLLCCGVVLLLTACTAPASRSPAPTAQAIQLNYPPALSTWVEKFTACASKEPLVALFLTPATTQTSDLLPNEIGLVFGESFPFDESMFPSQLGTEQILVLVNQENDGTWLTMDNLRSIFSGEVSLWENNDATPIEVWILPDGDPIRTTFDRMVMQSTPITTGAMLAPDFNAMLEAVAENPGAIGYLTESAMASDGAVWLNQVKPISLDYSLEQSFIQPVIALTQGEPQGLLRDLLACVERLTP
jgi:hypothetical protein